jgi:hypothetical protein
MHKQLLLAFRAAFPDQHVSIDDLVAEGDKVVNRATYTGTHRGEFQGISPTGKRFTISGINISRIADGKIAEDWTVLDLVGMLQQIGAMPAPETAPAGEPERDHAAYTPRHLSTAKAAGLRSPGRLQGGSASRMGSCSRSQPGFSRADDGPGPI